MGLKLLTRSRISFSHLNKPKFIKTFPKRFDPECSCNPSVEDTVHFFMQCHHNTDIKKFFLNEISIDESIIHLSDGKLVKVLLYGKHSLNPKKNSKTLNGSVIYIIKLELFKGSLC